MPDLTTVTGIVATPPRHITTNSGLEITSFRLASGQRRFDREKQKWVEADTNWYTVTAFRQLALNLGGSLERGQHVLVSGRLRIRAWENGEKSGTSVEIEADAVGHDLSWGTSSFTRSVSATGGGDTAGDGGARSGSGAGGHLDQDGWALTGPGEPSADEGGSVDGTGTGTGADADSRGEADRQDQLVPF
ncbi:single-stranded DNA-binding protein [Herbiconiux solani]|uniref:single-stranded DNA-binding protein n=1 Tax=Herbiconiux solani TaxID=661329 RepID=UPI000A06B27F|nr:single-stranded DNA-binding protein [Herbiconiux solani]